MSLLQSWTVIRGATAAEITEIYGFVNEYNPSTLLQGDNRDFYGTVSGASDCGRVFQLQSNGALVSLAAFNGANGCPFQGGRWSKVLMVVFMARRIRAAPMAPIPMVVWCKAPTAICMAQRPMAAQTAMARCFE